MYNQRDSSFIGHPFEVKNFFNNNHSIKELFGLQATLEFRDVELDACFPRNSMSLYHRKFPPHFAPHKRIDRFTLNDKLIFCPCIPWSWLMMMIVRTTHVGKVIGRDSMLGTHPLPLLHDYTTKPLLHEPQMDHWLILTFCLCAHIHFVHVCKMVAPPYNVK